VQKEPLPVEHVEGEDIGLKRKEGTTVQEDATNC